MKCVNRLSFSQITNLLLQNPYIAEQVFRTPCVLPGAVESDEIELAAELAGSRGLLPLFSLWLFSGVVAGCDSCRADSIALPDVCRLEIEDLDVPAGVDEMLAGRWTLMPVLTCRQDVSGIVWFLAGILNPSNKGKGVAACGVGTDGMEAISLACDAATLLEPGISSGLKIFLPLLPEYDFPVDGPSIGLPAALAISFIAADMENSGFGIRFFATGAVDSRGTLQPAGMVMQKSRYAEAMEAVLVVPDSATFSFPENSVPCRSLAEALEIAAVLGAVPQNSRVCLAAACRNEPGLFLANLHLIPDIMIKNGMFDRMLAGISERRIDMLPLIAGALRNVVSSGKSENPLSGIVEPESMEELAVSRPDAINSLLEIAAYEIAFSNHAGDPERARKWLERAGAIAERVNSEFSSKYIHYNLVAERHNRYLFEPELPADFLAVLELEEKMRELSGRDSWNLGAMYGSVAQNYAFCGPEWLENVVLHLRRSRKAFGSTFCNEHKRLDNYLVYALLDAGLHEDAADVLERYLGMSVRDAIAMWGAMSVNEDRHDIDFPYMLALTLRFIADTESKADIDDLRNAASAVFRHGTHPFQLAALNAGRIFAQAGDMKTARCVLERSADIAFSNGVTVKIMAMLPLAYMHVYAIASERGYSSVERLSCMPDENADVINTQHFQSLVSCGTARDICERLVEDPARWFPFSYR